MKKLIPSGTVKTFAVLLAGIVASAAAAASLRDLPVSISMLEKASADGWSIMGRNIIIQGGIHIPAGEFELFADRAVINIDSQDIEAAGNIRVLRWKEEKVKVPAEKIAELERMPDMLVEIDGVDGNIFGENQVSVKVKGLVDNISAGRMAGNLSSGYFRFDDVQLKYSTFVCRAKSAERRPDGVIEAKDAEISSCVYLEQNNAHYSLGAGTIRMTPRRTEFYGTKTIVKDSGDYDVTFFNGFVRVFGIPVMWLPVFHKPKDISPGLFSTQFGRNGGWGYYVKMSKYFQLTDYPRAGMRVHGDWYINRGFGYGVTGDVVSETSRTDFFAYSIYDIRPYASDDYDDYRLKVPHNRFDFRISNITHITPRLDFRGAFEYASDLYFTRDYFSSRYNANPQPATYAALEQQFDHFSASIIYRPRLNDFYTTSEKLPEIRLDIPRQEIFNTGIYYQGDFDSSYNRMKWIEFDYDHIGKRKIRNHLSDYQAYRFDTTHFLYLPIRLDWLTLTPRAGFKFTAYSDSSEGRVTTNDLLSMFTAADPECVTNYKFRNYDSAGGARVRALGELGFEASTKLHNTWNDVHSTVMQLDGLRHVMRPYINYTYIGSPSAKRDYLFYFDDTDRIERQHFFRFGLENRLQTRASDSSIRTWFAMENYWDLYLENSDGFGEAKEFSRIGSFCTVLTAEPIKGLTLRTAFVIDLGDNNGAMPEAERRGRKAGHPGINARWLDRWNVTLSYEPVEDFRFDISYVYNRPYSARSTYSMGSTLYQIDAGGFFDKYFKDYDELLTIGLSFPITPDRRTKGAVKAIYDFQDGSFTSLAFMLTRNFHCWELAAALAFTRDTDDDDHDWDTSVSVQARLMGLESPLQQRTNDMASKAVGSIGKGSDNEDKNKFF